MVGASFGSVYVGRDLPLLRACRRETTSFTPVWLMRQAGRYLPEYRAVRDRFTFLDLCKTPEAAAEVTLQPVELLGVDAAILFADILLPLEPLGLGLSFGPGEGPRIERPLRTAADVAALPVVDCADALSFVLETIRIVRRELGDRTPLIGFAGAPFTLASYAIEGGGSRDYRQTKRLLLGEPETWHALMTRFVDLTASYLEAQIMAGAEAVQLFDSWVGHLAPIDYRQSVLPHMQTLLARLARSGVPVIHFATGTSGLLEDMAAAGGDVISVDWRIDLRTAWQRIGSSRAIQGNLDPLVLAAPAHVIRERVRELLAQAEGRPGHIANLGHGLLPEIPVDGVRCFVDAVHELSAR